MRIASLREIRIVLLLVLGASVGLASDRVPEVILGDLDNPCGIAVQPGTGHVFVSESGRGRVVRIVGGKSQEVIVDFPMGRLDAVPDLQVGPLGLVFLNGNVLVVGGRGPAAGEEQVYIVQVPREGADPVRADTAMKLGPLKLQLNGNGGRDYFSLVATNEALFVANQGWIAVVRIRKVDKLHQPSGFGPLTRFFSTRPRPGSRSPIALALSPRRELVVVQPGEINDQADSRLAFYRLHDGKPLMNVATGLLDAVAIEYGAPQAPANKRRLYALDLAWKSPKKAGLYRLDAGLEAGRPIVRASRISALERPTSMVLGPDGGLYVTTLGDGTPNDDSLSGQVVRYLPGL